MAIQLSVKEIEELIQQIKAGIEYSKHLHPKVSGGIFSKFRDIGYSANVKVWGPHMRKIALDAAMKGIISVKEFEIYCWANRKRNDSKQLQAAHKRRESDYEYVKNCLERNFQIKK
jgi:hypothetical protein